MHRAWKRLVAAAGLGLAAAAIPLPAWAFHAGATFDKPPGAGGAGSIYYAGAPLEHGWTCLACHEGPAGKIKVQLSAEPADVFQSFEYEPGKPITFTATMVGEHAGLNTPLSNYNSIVVEVLDDKQNYNIGSMGGFAAEEFYTALPATIISGGQKPGETKWQFTWTAKDPDTLMPVHGPITLYLAAVDGNGANAPGMTLTDPFNDDVFTGYVKLKEKPGTMGRTEPSRPGTLVCALGVAMLGFAKRRRKSKDKAAPVTP